MARKLAEVSKTAPSTEDLSAQVATLQADVATLTELLAEFGKSKASELKGSAEDKLKELRASGEQHASAIANAASTQADELQTQANDFIKKQPAMALGIAAGLGFLIGYTSGRK